MRWPGGSKQHNEPTLGNELFRLLGTQQPLRTQTIKTDENSRFNSQHSHHSVLNSQYLAMFRPYYRDIIRSRISKYDAGKFNNQITVLTYSHSSLCFEGCEM